MRRLFGEILLFVLLVTLCGCASEYNQIRFKAGVDLPLPIMPIHVGVTLELKDALEEPLTDDEIFQQLVDQAVLDGWLVVPDPTEPDGVRISEPDGGERSGNDEHDQASGGSSGGPSGQGDRGGGADDGAGGSRPQ